MSEAFDDDPNSLSPHLGDCTDVQALCREIRALKHRAARAELENRAFRELAEHIHEVFWMTTPLGDELIYISPAYEAIWGQTCESLYVDPGQRLAWVHEADREHVLKAFKRDARAGLYDETYRIDRPDGEVRWIRDRAWRVHDDRGQLYRLAGFALDVTDRVENDDRLNRLGDELANRERIEIFAALGAGIAHDMAQPLTAARGHLARLRTPTDESTCQDVGQKAEAEIGRASDILHHLRDYAREGQPSLAWVRLDDLLADLHRMVDTLLRDAEIDYGVDIEDLTATKEIAIDRIFVQQILRNIVQNAIDALAGQDPRQNPNRRIQIAVHMPAEQEIEFRIGDNGPGLAEDTDPFTAFDSDKRDGLGLGLYVARSLARTHGGDLWVERDHAEWASLFVLHLPCGDDAGTAQARVPRVARISAVDA